MDSTMSADLACRAVACRSWKWMDGMAVAKDGRRSRVCLNSSGELYLPVGPAAWRVECAPDFSDSATLGCLIELVREAWAGRVVVSIGNGWFSVEADSEEAGFYADQDSKISMAAALVAALETAP